MHSLTVSLTSCGESSSHLAPCTPLLARVARTRPLQTRHHRRRRVDSMLSRDGVLLLTESGRPGMRNDRVRVGVPGRVLRGIGGRSLPGPSSPRSAPRDGLCDKGVDLAADADVDVVRSEPSLRSRGCPCAVRCAGGHCSASGLTSQGQTACGRYVSLDADA